MADLQKLLGDTNLSKYLQALNEYGIESMADTADLDDDDLAEAADACGMKKLHKKKFINGVKASRSGGATAAPVQQQQYTAPVQQYAAPVQPQVQQQYAAQPQPQAQAQAQPQAQAEQKMTEEERIEQRVELLAYQNPELHAKLQDEQLMAAFNLYNERGADDPQVQPFLNDPTFVTFVDQLAELYIRAQKGEVNKNPLVKCSLAELNRENINAFRCKMGALAFVMGAKVSANDDLIASNEFCQIAIGKRLVREKDEDENAQEEEKPLPLGWIKAFTPDGRAYYQNLVTKVIQWDAPTSDDEKSAIQEAKQDIIISEPQPDIIHNGVTHLFTDTGILDLSEDAQCPQLSFAPGTRNFTLCMEICCLNPIPPNAICANGLIDFFVHQEKIAVRTTIHELRNIGNTKLIPDFWYHVSIVCQRKQLTNDDGKDKGKKIDVTEFTIYLDGVEAGVVSLNGITNLDANALIGRTWNEQVPNNFSGGIRNFKLFYRDLNEDEVFAVAQNKANLSYKETKLLTYQPESLQIQLPPTWIKYNGPIYGKLPSNLQFTFTENEPRTITAYILLTRANSKNGSTIISNWSLWNGFELICPLPKTNVIGMRCSGSRDYDLISLGKTKLKLNRFYHIAVTIAREDNETRFVAYVNGKQDGNYTISKYQNLSSGAEWDIGFRDGKPIKTRFEGSIQNLRVFDYALCEAEVASVYAADLRECGFKKNDKILYLQPKGISNNCPKCNQACAFGMKFCSKCRAPLKEKSLLQYEKENPKPAGMDTATQWADAFNAAAQSYVEQEYGVSYNDPNAQPQQDEKTQEQLQFEQQQRLDMARKHETEFNVLDWTEGIFISRDLKKGMVTILDADNKQRKFAIHEVIKSSKDMENYGLIPATDALKIENIGGWVLGKDFHGNKFKICTNESGFVKYLVEPSCFNLLTNLKKFPKHKFEEIINNNEIRNYYVLNRLLYTAHELLRDINVEGKSYTVKYVMDEKTGEKKKKKDKDFYWTYFNEFILPWKTIWNDKPNGECVCGRKMQLMPANTCYAEYPGIGCDMCGNMIEGAINVYHCMQQQTLQHESGFDCCQECQSEDNFKKLQRVAKTLQQKYKQMQFDLFDELLLKNKNWSIFNLPNRNHATLENRQNSFKGGLTVELDPSKVSADIANTYDKVVATMLIWGRCKLLDQLFQIAIKDLFTDNPRCKYAPGPIKTYERMMEKADEYRIVDRKPFPASFSICDVNRCSIKCESLDDVLAAFNIVEKSGVVEIVRIKNRFLVDFVCMNIDCLAEKEQPECKKQHTGGYRDMLVNCLFTDSRSGLGVIAEIQFHLNAYEHIKHLQHKYYKVQRAQGQLSLLKNFEARKFDDEKKEKEKEEKKDDH